MSAELQRLRAAAADLKAAPIYSKAAKAEQLFDVLIALLAAQQNEIETLKGFVNGKK